MKMTSLALVTALFVVSGCNPPQGGDTGTGANTNSTGNPDGVKSCTLRSGFPVFKTRPEAQWGKHRGPDRETTAEGDVVSDIEMYADDLMEATYPASIGGGRKWLSFKACNLKAK